MTIGFALQWENIFQKMYKNKMLRAEINTGDTVSRKKKPYEQTGVSGDHTDHAIWYQYVGTDLPDVRSRHLAG